jgi:L-fuconolactonase
VIIDAHIHLWNLERGGYRWLTPELAPINRTIEFDDFARHLEATPVDGAIVVQSDESDADTDYLLDTAASHREILGVVGWLPLTSPARTGERLDQLSADRAFRGVRVGINMEPDADWLMRDDVRASLELVEARDLPFEVVSVRRRHLELVPELSERHPQLRMVIDHLSQPPIRKDDSWIAGWRTNLARAAANPNVYAKVSGLTPASGALDDWTAEDLRPFVEYAFEQFGPDRLMFGTDWPVSELAGGYLKVWEELSSLFDGLAPADRTALLGGTARRVYGLDVEGA